VNRTAERLAVTTPVLAVFALFGLGSGSALAASTNPASDQYGGGDVLGEATGGSLPFTGINLIGLLGLGLCMVAVGVAIRRASRRTVSNSHR
jgi:hypothetical protein